MARVRASSQRAQAARDERGWNLVMHGSIPQYSRGVRVARLRGCGPRPRAATSKLYARSNLTSPRDDEKRLKRTGGRLLWNKYFQGGGVRVCANAALKNLPQYSRGVIATRLRGSGPQAQAARGSHWWLPKEGRRVWVYACVHTRAFILACVVFMLMCVHTCVCICAGESVCCVWLEHMLAAWAECDGPK